MPRFRILSLAVLLVTVSCVMTAGLARAAGESDDAAIDAVIGLLGEKDQDLRTVALEQVRDQLKGPAATKRIAAVLPKLAPDAQVGLLNALGDRGDKAARPAVVELLRSTDASVRAAALRSLGSLGEAGDVPALGQALTASEAEKLAALKSLDRLRGEGVDEAVVALLKQAKGPARLELIGLLVSRGSTAGVPLLLEMVESREADLRTAARDALGKLAGPPHVADLVRILLKTEKGPEREAAEKVVMFACQRSKDEGKQDAPLLAAMEKLDDAQKTALLPALGRVGGARALAIVEAAIADKDAERSEMGLRALCNWPDASIAPKLIELAQKASTPALKLAALRALIRVAVLPDKRPAAEKLALLKQALAMATRDEERKLVVERARAIRTIESLRFVVPYLDDPKFAQPACATVVELAHHRNLREPNKAEFQKALDVVIGICKDEKLVHRAKLYKANKTL